MSGLSPKRWEAIRRPQGLRRMASGRKDSCSEQEENINSVWFANRLARPGGARKWLSQPPGPNV